MSGINDPTLITHSGTLGMSPPKGEPIAKPPMVDSDRVCDPRHLMNAIGTSMADLQEGDFVKAGGWSKPRLVERIETCQDGRVVFLAEHDPDRVNAHGIRRVDPDEWMRRDGWVRYPNLGALWRAAHGDS